jgi:hypothetical protein
MIRVEITSTLLVNTGNEYVILLHGTGSEGRTLPILIGKLEAQSIVLQLNHIPFPRPLTHDLLKDIIIKLNGKVIRTEICELKDETFFAKLIVQIGDKTMPFESRPSDAIAMSLRFNAPVFVNKKVMDEAGVFLSSSSTTQQSIMHLTEFTTDDVLRDQLKNAIAEERYEDAARLRDKINTITNSN